MNPIVVAVILAAVIVLIGWIGGKIDHPIVVIVTFVVGGFLTALLFYGVDVYVHRDDPKPCPYPPYAMTC